MSLNLPAFKVSRRFFLAECTLAVLVCSMFSACSGGGGGEGGGFDNGAVLTGLRFPDPGKQTPEPNTEPPSNASLVQQVIFQFSGRPNPSEISTSTIEVRDSNGLPVRGRFEVRDREVAFTPTLPTRAVMELGPGAYDTGGTSFQPGQTYSFRVGPDTWDFIEGVSGSLRAAFPDPASSRSIKFFVRTTTDPAQFFTGLEAVSPELVSTDPKDGASGISPNLLSDPTGLFPERRSYTLRFHMPVNPGLQNLAGFRVVDLDTTTLQFPDGLPLAVAARLLSNELDGAVVEVTPSGILPFGSLLALEYPSDLKGLAQGDSSGTAATVACTFTVAEVPSSVDLVPDAVLENFDTAERRGSNEDVGKGHVPSDWDRSDSNILQAAAAFEGAGELGRFLPAAPPLGETSSVVLDTSEQVFPLFDGSTPEAPVVTVRGGVFAFSDIDIPAGVVILPQGPNPLVLLSTGTVRLAGEIRADATAGVNESSYDSAVTSTPGGSGGVGGGRGGEGHPIVFWPPDSLSILHMVSPVRGGRGYGAANLGRSGGDGGETGILDHKPLGKNYELDNNGCGELFDDHGNGGRTPGGGGGSYLTDGNKDLTPAQYGIGNVRPDGKGGYLIPEKYEPDDLYWGQKGASPFSDSRTTNDFIGVSGELQEIVAGQGGGAGGSRMEAYYCGAWCKLDANPDNDALCLGGEFPLGAPTAQTFAASVGDGKGGGAGGGGGAVWIRALGGITVESTGIVTARGGSGGGGEALGCGNWGGGAGGGSGGAIILESAFGVTVRNGSRIEVTGGRGAQSVNDDNYRSGCNPSDDVPGVGGDGGHGIIQLQVPFGTTALVENRNSSIKPTLSWIDKENTRNPAAFTSLSQAVSAWYDVGRMIAREPVGTSPSWRFQVAGVEVTPGGSGEILVDASGFVIDPRHTDITCDFLGQFDSESQEYTDPPREDFIPTNARVTVEFQGAQAIADGSKEIDPASLTAWDSSPTVANAHQFLRYRITFNISADGSPLSPDLKLPVIQDIKISAEY